MTMNVSSVSATSAASSVAGNGAATTSGVSPVDGAAFSSSLAQLMNGSSTATSQTGLAYPLPLLADASLVEGNEQLALIEQLLVQLEAALKEAEQQIEQDSGLFNALHQWIVQAQNLLTQQEGQSLSAEQQAAIQALMNQPQTISIVALDQFEQFAQYARVMTNQATGEMAAVKVDDMLQHLKQLGEVLMKHQQANPNQTVLANVLAQVTDTNTVAAETLRQSLSATAHQEQGAGKSGEMMATAMSGDGSEVPTQQMTVSQFALRSEGMTSAKPIPQVPIQQFAHNMGEMLIKQMSIRHFNGTSEAKIRLYPEHLGQVDIKITMQNGQLIAQFFTEHAGAKEMIDQQLASLRGALQASGIQVDKLEVSQHSTAEASAMASSMFQGDRQSHSSKEQHSSSNRSSSKVDTVELDGNEIEGLDSEEQVNHASSSLTGSSFDASA
ncbi:flagellar hook-length control protein FliK [Paenibacillus arenosi]|uniref:Flagellar hook-length control protein FliK n=1 Tax=Paenibacillus arenosi TaxID=2774142 RepID=A0ABR9ASH6_9BACL|nr:flagellar hook-length control protein FliK [Paenibacillus arenosi]MBD8497064.1 flagellar hook-length control protein FliK [Paenibacillus arenosi]